MFPMLLALIFVIEVFKDLCSCKFNSHQLIKLENIESCGGTENDFPSSHLLHTASFEISKLCKLILVKIL